MSAAEPERTALRIHPRDNVICLLRDHVAGETPVVDGLVAPALAAAVPSGHKVAIAAVARGEHVVKFGHPIGRATADIVPGDQVHLHNLVGFTSQGGASR